MLGGYDGVGESVSTAPGLPLAAEELLSHGGALLCVLGDQTQPEQEVVVREDVGVRLGDEGAKDGQP